MLMGRRSTRLLGEVRRVGNRCTRTYSFWQQGEDWQDTSQGKWKPRMARCYWLRRNSIVVRYCGWEESNGRHDEKDPARRYGAANLHFFVRHNNNLPVKQPESPRWMEGEMQFKRIIHQSSECKSTRPSDRWAATETEKAVKRNFTLILQLVNKPSIERLDITSHFRAILWKHTHPEWGWAQTGLFNSLGATNGASAGQLQTQCRENWEPNLNG